MSHVNWGSGWVRVHLKVEAVPVESLGRGSVTGQSENMCREEAKCRLGPILQGFKVLGKGCNCYQKCCVERSGAGQHCWPSESWRKAGSGRQWTAEMQRGAGGLEQRAGRLGCVLQVELAGLRDRVGEDFHIPFSLFCLRMLTPAPPQLPPPAQWVPRPSSGLLWPLIFSWASLLPSLSPACLVLPWS